nr:hypothetical protein [Candidatus Freyarchaeota archaeon]
MSKAITTGVFGSVSGIVTTVVGILWSIRYFEFIGARDSAVTIQNLPIINPSFLELAVHLGFFQNIHVSSLLSGLQGLTTILALLLVLTLILTGVGLYGLGKIEGKSMGVVSLVVGVIAAIIVLLLLLGGAVAGSRTPTIISLLTSIYAPWLITQYPISVIVLAGGVPHVNILLLSLGLLVSGVALIIFGATFINVREGLDSSNLSLATGILSIIAGIVLFFVVLLAFIAFIILFVTFIMAALVFFQSRELA